MDRLILTVGLIILIALAVIGMRWGWKNRLRRQASKLGLPELPVVPADLGAELATRLDGLYVSSTPAGRWQDRLLVHGLGRRAKATAALTEAGVLINRVGEDAIFVPAASLRSVDTAPGIAGKVMGMADGILVIGWQLGDLAIESGFRAEDLDQQEEWIAAARSVLTNNGASA